MKGFWRLLQDGALLVFLRSSRRSGKDQYRDWM